MPIPSAKISDLIARVQRARKAIESCTSQLSRVELDRETLGAEAEKHRRADYRNETALQAAQLSERKLLACQAKLQDLEGRYASLVNPELGDLMNEAEQAVLGFLNLAMASRIETIKAVVRPFCESDGIAEQVAKMTTSYQVGAQMVWLLSSGSDRVRGSGDVRAAVATLRNLETLLCESLKEHPDFNQWISVTPAAVGSPT